jgi:phosphoribosylaminoimidazole-succinocarboxamide synthase
MKTTAILQTEIREYPLFTRGKVRDVYDLGDKLLIVATDRISAFDCVMPTPITGKGQILTQMSLFWFKYVSSVVKNHLVATEVRDFPKNLHKYRDILEGRSVLVNKAKRIDIECVARGYLAGSGWKDYKKTGTVCGIKLPAELQESQILPEPLFTPSTKAASGHDENINLEQAAKIVGRETAEKIKSLTLAVYKKAHDYAWEKGIIIADTKFEFGFLGGEIILIDEILSPDSSRFWPRDTYKVGGSPASYDKQFVRDYLETLDWNKTPPAPALPPEIVKKTLQKYQEAFRLLCG